MVRKSTTTAANSSDVQASDAATEAALPMTATMAAEATAEGIRVRFEGEKAPPEAQLYGEGGQRLSGPCVHLLGCPTDRER